MLRHSAAAATVVVAAAVVVAATAVVVTAPEDDDDDQNDDPPPAVTVCKNAGIARHKSEPPDKIWGSFLRLSFHDIQEAGFGERSFDPTADNFTDSLVKILQWDGIICNQVLNQRPAGGLVDAVQSIIGQIDQPRTAEGARSERIDFCLGKELLRDAVAEHGRIGKHSALIVMQRPHQHGEIVLGSDGGLRGKDHLIGGAAVGQTLVIGIGDIAIGPMALGHIGK